MSCYNCGNKAPTLMAQAPNRKGNQSKHVPGPGNSCAGKVQVSKPKESYGANDGYRSSSLNK